MDIIRVSHPFNCLFLFVWVPASTVLFAYRSCICKAKRSAHLPNRILLGSLRCRNSSGWEELLIHVSVSISSTFKRLSQPTLAFPSKQPHHNLKPGNAISFLNQ